VHQVARYDTDHGISYWTKNYRTAIEVDDELALSREYPYYDPIYMLPEAGQAWWRTSGPGREPTAPRWSASPTRPANFSLFHSLTEPEWPFVRV